MRMKLTKFLASAASATARKASSSDLAGPPTSSASSEAIELRTKKRLFQAPFLVSTAKSSAASKKKKKNSSNGKKKASIGISSQVLGRLTKPAVKESQIESTAPEVSVVEVTGSIQDILGGQDSEAEFAEEKFSFPRGQDSEAEFAEEKFSFPRGHNNMMALSSPKSILGFSWFTHDSEFFEAQQRKELSRKRKQKYIFNGAESYSFTKLMRNCACKFGPNYTLDVFGKIGRETGIKDYIALINHCIANARQSSDEDSSIQIHKVYQLFASMRERGFQIEEESFGVFLKYMIDKKMVQEFQVFTQLIKDVNPESYSRLGYYEMLLWITVGDEDKIRELCKLSGVASIEDCYNLAVSYLLAFCDSDRKEEVLQLLEVVDITRISSSKYLSTIFKSLGRLQFENFMKKFILALQVSGEGEQNVSSFVYDYATSIQNLEVEEIISKFRNLHEELGLLPSVVSCEKLIKLCCKILKVHAAVEVVDLIFQFGLDIPEDFFDPLLHACERSSDFNMVRPIYSVMRRHNLTPNAKTFKNMISLCVRMKDFQGAYNILADAKEIEGVLTANMYNAIMAGYFREKNNFGALMVLKQMEDAHIQPNSETYSYLIANCELKEDVLKYRDEIHLAGVEITKHVHMAFINAYAKFGNFELAKQVVLDRGIKSKYLNELKSVLVSALSSNGQISDALHLYDELKHSGCTVEPKAVISLIEHIQSEGELDRLLQLLEELNDSSCWFDGCSRVILYCVQYKFVSSSIELLKKLKDKDRMSTYVVLDQIFSRIWELGPTDLISGLKLLRAIKEELHLHPSRTSLDFLLSSCVKSKNLQQAQLVWSEYEEAGLSYNVLTFLRMYQALLAAGAPNMASEILKKVPKDDPHVNYIIKSCKETFVKPLTK